MTLFLLCWHLQICCCLSCCFFLSTSCRRGIGWLLLDNALECMWCVCIAAPLAVIVVFLFAFYELMLFAHKIHVASFVVSFHLFMWANNREKTNHLKHDAVAALELMINAMMAQPSSTAAASMIESTTTTTQPLPSPPPPKCIDNNDDNNKEWHNNNNNNDEQQQQQKSKNNDNTEKRQWSRSTIAQWCFVNKLKHS